MPPALLLTILAACLLALLPVWRLRVAGWFGRTLLAAWLVYAVAIVAVIRFPGPFRFLVPILVLAVVAPFVAGPERLSRVLGGRRPPGRVIIDVTPTSPPGLPEPSTDDAGDEREPPTGA